MGLSNRVASILFSHFIIQSVLRQSCKVCMYRAKEWLLNAIMRRPKLDIPDLPDDILVMIFDNLSTAHRVSLAVVCKRFRAVDLNVGNRVFEAIVILLHEESDEISSCILNRGSYSFKTSPNGDFEDNTPGISKFFKNVTTKSLTVFVSPNRYAKASNSLSSLMHLFKYSFLYFYFNCTTDFSEFLFRFFNNFNNRYLEEVMFRWKNLKGQNVLRLQEALELLPILKEVTVMYNDYLDEGTVGTVQDNDPESFLLNGDLILPLLKRANDVTLRSVHCTAREIMNAFEMICESKIDHGYISIRVIDSAIDDLHSLAAEMGRFEIENNRIMDFARGYALSTRNRYKDNTGSYTSVTMFKIDANGDGIFDD